MSHTRDVPNAWNEFIELLDTPSVIVASQFLRGTAGGELEFTDDVLQKSGGTVTGDLAVLGTFSLGSTPLTITDSSGTAVFSGGFDFGGVLALDTSTKTLALTDAGGEIDRGTDWSIGASYDFKSGIYLRWSSTGAHSGAKDLILQRYNDGSATWLRVSTGAGIAATKVAIGPTPITLSESGSSLLIDGTVRVDPGIRNLGGDWYLSNSSSLASTFKLQWSSIGSYGGAKDLILQRYNDGTNTWLHVSTGQGLVADQIQLGTAGGRLKWDGTYVVARNNADSATVPLQCGYLYTTGSTGVLTSAVKTPSGNITLTLQKQNFTAADNAIEMATGTFSASTGAQVGVAILPTYNQSGNAQGTDLLIQRTATAVGSGTQHLLRCMVGPSTYFSVVANGAFAGPTAYQFISVTNDWALRLTALQLANDNEVQWSSDATFYGSKDAGLARYHDGTSAWVKVTDGSTGNGNLVANQVMIGGTSGPRWTWDGSYLCAVDPSGTKTYGIVANPVYTLGVYSIGVNTLVLQNANFTTADNAIEMATGSWTHSSGESAAVAITPEYISSGTASQVSLLVDATETAIGSGGHLLADFRVGGVSQASFGSTGSLTIGTTPFVLSNFLGHAEFNTTVRVQALRGPSSLWYLGTAMFALGSGTGFQWSSTTTYSGAKDAGLARYHDGTSAWVKVTDGSTGNGNLVADHVMIGGTSGVRLYESSNYLYFRDASDSVYRNIRAGFIWAMDAVSGFRGAVIGAPSVDTTLLVQDKNFTSADNAVEMATGSWTHSSGEGVAVAITPTYNSSGTASQVSLLVDATETALGSGGHLLADFRVVGVSKANLSNVGTLDLGGGALAAYFRVGSNFRLDGSTGLQLASDISLMWSSTTAYSGSKDVGLARYHDGTSAWVKVTDGSTGNGNLVANQVMIGGTSGVRLKKTSSYLQVRNQADSGFLDVQAGNVYANASCRSLLYLPYSPNTTLNLQNYDFTAADHAVDIATGTWTHSSGEGVACAITPTYNSTGTASQVSLLVDATETAIGSGGHLLADFRVGGVSKASVKNDGRVDAYLFAVSDYSRGFLVSDQAYYKGRGLDMVNTFEMRWSLSGTYYGTKDAGLARYHDGTSAWVKVTDGSTGNGNLVADHVMVGGTSGYRLIASGSYVTIRNNADTGNAPIYASYFTAGSSSGVRTPLVRSVSVSTLELQDCSFTAADNAIEMATGTWTHSSGIGVGVAVTPVMNSSGTAGYRALAVDVTETATGSGTQYLYYGAVGGSVKFGVDSGGAVIAKSYENINAYWLLGTGSWQLADNIDLRWSSTSSRAGTKDAGLARYHDGTSAWVKVTNGSTGDGNLVADHVLIGGTSGPRLKSLSNMIWFRNNDDSASASVYGATGTFSGGLGSPYLRHTTNSTLQVQFGRSFSTADNALEMANCTFTHSSGEGVACAITPTYNSSGTASQVSLLVDATETALGSGGHDLLDLRASGISRLRVTNAGLAWIKTGFADVANTMFLDTGDGLKLGSALAVTWASTAAQSGAKDSGLARYHDGSVAYVDVTDGSTGQGRLRVGAGSAASPGLAIGASVIGLYEQAANQLGIVVNGGVRWQILQNYLQSTTSGAPYLQNTAGNSSDPVFAFNGDTTTGIGRAAANQLSHVAGGAEVARCLLDGSSNPVLRAMSVFSMLERSSDPAAPAEGESIVWLSDGTGKGSDGDVMVASTAGGATKYGTLFSHADGDAW